MLEWLGRSGPKFTLNIDFTMGYGLGIRRYENCGMDLHSIGLKNPP